MRPLILTGGPAVGKTTCRRALAVERDRAAYVDVEDARRLIVAEPRRNGCENPSHPTASARRGHPGNAR
jgi:predicted ATPase